jgi:hypothetical protein
MTIIVTGCKKMEEVYSCDPVTNEWVKSNLKTIRTMNRQDMLQLEPEKQMGAFVAFTPEQKYNCWVDKLEQVKSLEWTVKEFAHICLLAETMKLEWFEDKYKKNNFEKIDHFLTQWVNDGAAYFGWTKDELGRMVACLHDVAMEDQNVVLKAASGVAVMKGIDPACTCSRESDWCSWGEKCKNIPCQGREWGCGTLIWHRCDGRCGENVYK